MLYNKVNDIIDFKWGLIMINVGINGFGRIGRTFLRIASSMMDKEFNIVAINARANIETLAHLFKYDSCFGIFNGEIKVEEDFIIVNGNKIKVTRFDNPKDIPWIDFGVDLVIESTGKFKTKEELMGHVMAGAKKVLLTAPGKDDDITVVMGVNDSELDINKHTIISNASCTTNCLAPIVKVIDEKFVIEKGFITTVHSMTNDQQILDKTHKDLRRARAAGESIVPTTTGAAKAISKVIPHLKGRLDGFALRVPTAAVSITDFVCIVSKEVTVKEVNDVLQMASECELKNILGVCDLPLVSIDFKGDSRSSIVDGLSTMTNGNMIKIAAWYDNEWGYSSRVVDLANKIAKMLT